MQSLLVVQRGKIGKCSDTPLIPLIPTAPSHPSPSYLLAVGAGSSARAARGAGSRG